MGSTVRLAITYGDRPGPPTLVAKLAAGDPSARSQMAFGFRKEVGFYRDLADTLTVRAPRCWYHAISDDGANFVLVLDDLAPSVPGVQASGCTVDQATGALENLAALHAPRWNDESLKDLEFLSPIDEGVAELFGAGLEAATPQFIERYADALGDDDVATLEATAKAIVPWTLDRPKPFSVVHGDYRLDNLMFPRTDGDVVAVDWQSVSVGPPGRDVAYFIATCFDAEERRKHEEQLVAAYHAELVRRGVEGYDVERCFDDYCAGHLQGPLITVLGAIYATAQRSESADRMFIAMATRTCAAIRDLGTLDRVTA
jgi:hypothetical protein